MKAQQSVGMSLDHLYNFLIVYLNPVLNATFNWFLTEEATIYEKIKQNNEVLFICSHGSA